jgi:GrpB-like predicted nucleotidyltransferase (UPF0157 family)
VVGDDACSGEVADAGRWYEPASLHLVDYDESWPASYEADAAALRVALAPELDALEHVGSTAVPGMVAKPVIDILAAVRSWGRFDMMVDRLQDLGYVYTPESEADDPQRRVFRKGPNDFRMMRTHHLHVTLSGSQYWKRIMAFRDRLRADPRAAARYADLKRELITQHRSDSRAYTAAKTTFVTQLEVSGSS